MSTNHDLASVMFFGVEKSWITVRWCYAGFGNFKSSKQYFVATELKFLFVYNNAIVCTQC